MNRNLETATFSRRRVEGRRNGRKRIRHLAIRVNGTVQGVGFRPFIFNLARRCGVSGTVLNDNGGVLIHAQGGEGQLREFIGLIQMESPPAARIDAIKVGSLAASHYAGFRILPSETLPDSSTVIPADIALCPDCLREMHDPKDRRFGYPFINCTNCGPRFTITRGLPYDRPLTTMARFEMCAECRAEYENPADRRFHAQPIACPKCGPKLTFLESQRGGWGSIGGYADAVDLAVGSLRKGRVIMLQGIGGFHLACDARDEAAVSELRRRKGRYEKPFALMFPDINQVHIWCEVSNLEERLLVSPEAPIVLLRKRADCEAARSVAPDNPLLGAMLPYSPLHVLILERFGAPLVMTSANRSDDPIAFEQKDALKRLHGIADYALVHDREIHVSADDSVVMVIGSQARMIRRARGFVPRAVRLPQGFRREVLAFGPQLKNTLCLGKRNTAILSQHVGDMDSEISIAAHRRAMDHLIKLFDARIGLAACDLHPDYTTTRLAEDWSREQGVPLVRVQHHHAHLTACLAENGVTEPSIGLCLDGTGYGTDGTIWGGELLVGNAAGFQRNGYLLPVPMPGGELAARQPWRMAWAWLHRIYGERVLELPMQFIQDLRRDPGEKALAMLDSSLDKSGLFPLTSSLGRLFDAVAAILFFGSRPQYEGQAAALLEWMMSPQQVNPYPVELAVTEDSVILSPIPMFLALMEDLNSGTGASVISRRFHEWVVEGFVRMCEITRERTGLNTVALTGGCFQNAFLLSACEERLGSAGFRALTHRDVPTNDGGVALGQAAVANAKEL